MEFLLFNELTIIGVRLNAFSPVDLLIGEMLRLDSLGVHKSMCIYFIPAAFTGLPISIP